MYHWHHAQIHRWSLRSIRSRVEVMVGTVNANREYFEMGVKDLAQAEAEYPGWLSRLLTHPVRGLENYQQLFAKLTNPNGAIKVFCEVAEL